MAETTSSELDDAKARVRAQYGSVGDAYVKSAGHATGKDLARMVEVARPLPTERLLDIATGGGHVARTFSPYVGQIVASDLTPEILHHAGVAFAEQGLVNIETRIADAESLPFDDGSFEIVTCRIAPHHFPHPDRFVSEVARVLTPGGRFILIDSTVPDGDAGVFVNRIEKLRDPSHVRSLTIGEWQALLAANGFDVATVETFPKRHDFEEWTSRSRMAADDREELANILLNAPEATREALRVEIADGRLIAFSDTKTLFATTRE
jgi:ubiquinone/menaquinone biosynthesis C-methylase UbiE